MISSCRYLFLLMGICYGQYVTAQSSDYFQQELHYTIHVRLDDVQHELDGHIEIVYKNNAPYPLHYLYIHLWPNAYKNTQTAYARQAVENGDTRFWFSKPEDKGYIDRLDFKVNGRSVLWLIDSSHIDICKILLNEPLLPHGKIVLSTPFHVKIPKTFSRLGHEGQSYQITQWYPKPAVFDQQGWHPMPYLDQGEFYSEFGSYDVFITLPKNYVVGATGYLQNEEEHRWLDSLAAHTTTLDAYQLSRKRYISSDRALKTLHYHIDNAHDFAWFADKRYHVLKGEVELPQSKRKVTTWAFFTHLNASWWKEAISYINGALTAYSSWIGEYPYEVCTAVQGVLRAGGGMEYPTITVIGEVNSARALETVIVHEVGHNWFQGVLGNNERRYPWMDEGINSFYEQRYMQHKYPDDYLIGKFKRLNRFLGIDFFKEGEYLKIAYQTVSAYRRSQPVGLSSEQFNKINYGVTVYGKGAWIMQYVQAYLGDSLFDASMQQYYRQWQFKHPKPEDLKKILEGVSGKQLDWFFYHLLQTTEEPHYQITTVKPSSRAEEYTVCIRNCNNILFPLSLEMTDDGRKNTLLFWSDGFTGDSCFTIRPNVMKPRFCIDCANVIPSIHRPAFYSKKCFRLKYLAAYDRPDRRELFFLPWAGWNNYDKTMLGMAFYNHTIPFKPFTFEVMPLYAFGTRTATGMGRMSYTFFIRHLKLHHVEISASGRRYGWQVFPRALMYNKLQPMLLFQFTPSNARSPVKRALRLRSIHVWQETDFYNMTEKRNILQTQYYYINEISFLCTNDYVLHPVSWSVHVQQGAAFVKLFGEVQADILYTARKGLFIRYFIGGFPWQNIPSGNIPDPRLRMNFSSGFGPFIKDYTLDELLLGRSDFSGFLSRQVVLRDGGFRTLTSLGQTNSWLTALNLSSSMPGKIPLQPFLSLGAYGDANSSFNFAFEAGISVVIVKHLAELHLPLATWIQANFGQGRRAYKWHVGMRSNDTNNMHYGSRYYHLITFTLNPLQLNPFEKVKQLVY